MGGGCSRSAEALKEEHDSTLIVPQRGAPETSLSKRLCDRGVKIVLLGEMSTGKTCVVLRLVKGEFIDNSNPTIGAAFLTHRIPVDEFNVKLEIWDTAGQERFRSLAPMYYRGAAAAVLVYDITKPSSFDTMVRWVEELKVRGPPNIVLAFAGNKLDLAAQRLVPTEQVEDYISKIEEGGGGRPFFRECSAKTGEGVQELFAEVCAKIVANARAEDSQTAQP